MGTTAPPQLHDAPFLLKVAHDHEEYNQRFFEYFGIRL
jgi:hypothetical protein